MSRAAQASLAALGIGNRASRSPSAVQGLLALLVVLLAGLVSPASAQTLSDDASLSGLSLSAGWMWPAFSSGVMTYDASVGYSVERVTVTAAKNHSSATVAFLDGDEMPLTDADTAAEGQQVDLSVGDTVVKVKVTAQDTTTVETYTVTITRPAQDMSLSPLASDPVAALESSASYTVTFHRQVDHRGHTRRCSWGCALLASGGRRAQRGDDVPRKRRDCQRRGGGHGRGGRLDGSA